jgi:hypothetical protein
MVEGDSVEQGWTGHVSLVCSLCHAYLFVNRHQCPEMVHQGSEQNQKGFLMAGKGKG